MTKLSPGEAAHRWPQVHPGSQSVVFTALGQAGISEAPNIDVISLKTGKRKMILRGGFSARYLAAASEDREREAAEWIEGLIQDSLPGGERQKTRPIGKWGPYGCDCGCVVI